MKNAINAHKPDNLRSQTDRLSATLVITTYNRPDALELVLQSVAHQTTQPQLIIIADDGSKQSTEEVIKQWQQQLPIMHCWQPDYGFRASRARNLSLSKATADIVIFIDGDCIIPPNFVEKHIRLSDPGKIVAGSRYLLSMTQTQNLLSKKMISDRIFSNKKFRVFYLGFLRDLFANRWKIVRTCNVSFRLNDILAVRGFDERYTGWGNEDSDLVIRLLKNHRQIRSARFYACVAHLWHEQASRMKLKKNKELLSENLNSSDQENSVVSLLE